MKLNKKAIIIIGIVAIVVIGIILGIVISINSYNQDVENDKFKKDIKENTESKIIEIPKGSSPTKIANILKENNIIKYPEKFVEFAIQTGNDKKLKYGNFSVNYSMSYEQIIKELQTNGVQKDSVKIVVPEGYELRQIVDLLVEKGIGKKEQYVEAIKNYNFEYDFLEGLPATDTRLEGYLFPATYYFEKTASEASVLDKMLNTFNERFKEEYKQKAKEMNMTINELITLASIIEREAGNDKERAKVASVFHNRLNSSTYPYLESCATVQYILKERKAVLSYEDVEIKSPYNTYKNKGLPPYPIASPGINSIEAALYPEKTDYYFFCLSKAGEHLFAKTYQEHLENMKK